LLIVALNRGPAVDQAVEADERLPDGNLPTENLIRTQRLELQAINREYLETTPIEATEIAQVHSALAKDQPLTAVEGQ
jgi:hypothetical protein